MFIFTNFVDNNILVISDSNGVKGSVSISNHCGSDDSVTSRDALTSEYNEVNTTYNDFKINTTTATDLDGAKDAKCMMDCRINHHAIHFNNPNLVFKDCENIDASSQIPIIKTHEFSTIRKDSILEASINKMESETILNNLLVEGSVAERLRLPDTLSVAVPSLNLNPVPDTVYFNPLACRTWSSDLALNDTNRDFEECCSGYESV